MPVDAAAPTATSGTSSVVNQSTANAQAGTNDGLGMMAAATAQTLQLQMAMFNHNMTVGPFMKAAEASGDAKK